MVRIKIYLALVLILAASAVTAADVEVTVYPERPSIAESFRLIFVASEKLDGDPDFSPLEGLFEIVGRNQSTQVKWVNGKHSAITRWELEVIAQKAGDLVIPAIKFGSSASSPTSLTVDASSDAGMVASNDLLLEIDVDDPAPYVQQQVVLTIRLLRRITIADAKLTEPGTSGDVIIKTLSNDRTYQDDRNGKRYEVFERRFALYPQSSGKLAISPFTVTAQVPRGARSLFDPFRASTTTRRVQSNAIQLEVKPVPDGFTGSVWLPAKKLSVREEWEPQDLRLINGEPATRTLFLWSEGLTAGQLPDFPELVIDSTTVYPDKVKTSEDETADGFSAIKQQKFALITKFSRTADEVSLVIPAIEIPWWNVETDQMEVARVPAKTLQVEFSQSPQMNPTNIDELLKEDSEVPASRQTEIILDAAEPGVWKILAILAFVGWLATVVLWRLRSRRPQKSPASGTPSPAPVNPKTSRLEKDIIHAANSDDPYAARQGLLLWGKHVLEDEQIRTLGQLARAVDAELGDEIHQLNDYFYAQADAPWRGEGLRNAIKNSKIRKNESRRPRSAEQLTPLFKLN
ncbi:MAG: BatD family protein [Gammaproteobacteria bacterium]